MGWRRNGASKGYMYVREIDILNEEGLEEYVVLKVNVGNKDMIVAVIYNPPRNNIRKGGECD